MSMFLDSAKRDDTLSQKDIICGDNKYMRKPNMAANKSIQPMLTAKRSKTNTMKPKLQNISQQNIPSILHDYIYDELDHKQIDYPMYKLVSGEGGESPCCVFACALCACAVLVLRGLRAVTAALTPHLSYLSSYCREATEISLQEGKTRKSQMGTILLLLLTITLYGLWLVTYLTFKITEWFLESPAKKLSSRETLNDDIEIKFKEITDKDTSR